MDKGSISQGHFPNETLTMHLKHTLDRRVVGVSHLVSLMGIYIAVCIAEQLRQSLIDDRQVHGYKAKISRSKKHIVYLTAVGLALGGVAVWGMHYFSLLSLVLTDPSSDERVHFQSSVPVQVLSYFMICITSTIGLTIASHDDMFSRSKASIVDEFMRGADEGDSFNLRKISTRSILFTIMTKKLDRIVLGGLIGAAGIVSMFFFSMQGIVFPGHVELNVGLSIVGAVLCVISTICEYWILFRLLSIFPEKEWLRFAVAAAGMFSCTIPNYLALAYASFHVGSPTHLEGLPTDHLWGQRRSFNVAFQVSNGTLWFMIMYLIWTSRNANMKQARYLRQAEAILYKVADEQNITSITQSTKGSGNLGRSHTVTVKSLVEQYLNKRFALEMELLEAHQRELAMEAFGQEKLNRLLERERQANMGFVHFIGYLMWLAVTLRWGELYRALQYELLSDLGSKEGNKDGREFDQIPDGGDEAAENTEAGHAREPVFSLAELAEITRHGAEEHKRVISKRLVPAYALSAVNSSRETVSSFRRSISRRSGLNSRAPTPKVVPIAESESHDPENSLLNSPILENPDLHSILQSRGKEAINVDV